MPYTPHVTTLQQAFGQRPFSVFSVTRLVLEPGATCQQATVHASFVFTVEGAAAIAAPGWNAQVRPSVAAHLCVGTYTFAADSEGPWDAVVVSYVSGRGENGLLPPVFDRCWLYEPADAAEVAKRALDLEKLGQKPDLESRLNQIIGTTTFLKGLFDVEPAAKGVPEGLRRARAHIEEHYADPLTLEQLGAIAGLPPKRFSEQFNQAFGKRPLAFLIGTRMEHATELLGTELLVKDIARMVGYDDQFYFSRIYKKYCGASPEAARKALRSSPDAP